MTKEEKLKEAAEKFAERYLPEEEYPEPKWKEAFKKAESQSLISFATSTAAKEYWQHILALTVSQNNIKPDISVALQDFIDEVKYMMGLYGKQKYTQAELQRDKLAEKLDDIMRLGSNDR